VSSAEGRGRGKKPLLLSHPKLKEKGEGRGEASSTGGGGGEEERRDLLFSPLVNFNLEKKGGGRCLETFFTLKGRRRGRRPFLLSSLTKGGKKGERRKIRLYQPREKWERGIDAISSPQAGLRRGEGEKKGPIPGFRLQGKKKGGEESPNASFGGEKEKKKRGFKIHEEEKGGTS